MARFVYNKSKVQNGMDYLKEAKKKLDGITADINRGIKTIESANGYKYLSIDYSGMTKLEESAKEMVSSLEDLINEKIQKIEEYNAFRNEHPIKSKFYDFSMGATSIIHGIHDGAASIGDGGLAVAGAVGGIFSDTWKECCEETLVERKTKRDGWYEKQYSTGIWSDVEKYSSYSSKSTKANILKGVGGAVPFVAAAVGTGGAAAAGSISSTTALAADSTLAAYSALGDRTASGLVNGEDFDTAYGQGTKSAVVAGVSTFALGKGAEKLSGLKKGSKEVSKIGKTETQLIDKTDDAVRQTSKVAEIEKAENAFVGKNTGTTNGASKISKAQSSLLDKTDDVASGAKKAVSSQADDITNSAKKVVSTQVDDAEKTATKMAKEAEKEAEAAFKQKKSILDKKLASGEINKSEYRRALKEIHPDTAIYNAKAVNSAENASDKVFVSNESKAVSKAKNGVETYEEYVERQISELRAKPDKVQKGVDSLKATIAESGSGSAAKDIEEVGKYMYEADKKLNLARKAGASSAEIEELEIARDSAKQVFNEMGQNADFYLADARILDNAEENLAKAIKNGASNEEISLLREERDFARRMHSSSYGAADDVVKQSSKIDTIKSGIKNGGTSAKETVSTAAKNGAAKVSNAVKGATANISEAAAKAGAGIKSASTVFAENAAKAGTVARGVGVAAVKNPKVAAVTVGSAAAVAGSHVNPINRNTDLGGINIADVSDSVITAQAAEIFENRTVAREDEDKQPDNTTNTQDTGTQTGGNSSDNTGGSSNGSSKYASTIESRTSQATKDKTKKIIETITNKKTDKTTTQPTNNTVVNNVAPTQPANTNTNNTPNTPIVTNNTNSTPTQQTVATVPTNTEVVAHQVNNNPEVSKTTYTGPTTVKGGSSTQSSYSNYGGSVNNNKSSIASVTKDVINKTKSAANTDIGSKVKSIIGDKKIDPIVIDDTTPSSTRRSGAGLAVSGVVAAGTALGIGTKVVLDKRKRSEEYDDEIEEITQDDGYDTDSAVYDNSKEDDSNIEMLYDDPYENDEGAAYDDSYDDIAYGETEDLVTF